MNAWITFSILSAFTWSIVNIIDKYLMTKVVKSPITPLMFMGIIGLILSPIIFFFNGFVMFSPFEILLSLLIGLSFVLYGYFYFKAVQIEEISKVVPLLYLAPLIILVLSGIFLNEIFKIGQYIGIISLILGAIVITSNNFKLNINKSFWFMIASVTFLAINQTLTKYLLNSNDFWSVFSYSRLGTFLVLIPVYIIYKHELWPGKKVASLISFNEGLAMIATLLITISIAKGTVTLANALSSVQPFFVLVLTIIITLNKPKLLKEEINKSIALQKFTAILLMIVGSILII